MARSVYTMEVIPMIAFNPRLYHSVYTMEVLPTIAFNPRLYRSNPVDGTTGCLGVSSNIFGLQ